MLSVTNACIHINTHKNCYNHNQCYSGSSEAKEDYFLAKSELPLGPTLPVQQKSSFFAITFDPNAFSEIHESKTFYMQLAI